MDLYIGHRNVCGILPPVFTGTQKEVGSLATAGVLAFVRISFFSPTS